VGTTTSSCTSTASSGKFYILNATTLTGYTISSGTMTAISGASFNGFTNATAMAISADGSYLFVASNAGITPFTISSSGALTQGTVFDTNDGTIEAWQSIRRANGCWLLTPQGTSLLGRSHQVRIQAQRSQNHSISDQGRLSRAGLRSRRAALQMPRSL
jgi:hypothetical protein